MDAAATPANHILGSLSPGTLASMRPYLTRVTLVKSQVIYEINAELENVYFLDSGVAMLVADTGDNAQVQIGMVGREGFTGTVSLLDGDLRSLHKAVIQVAGSALRIPVHRFLDLAESLPELKARCLHHLKSLMLQISQCSACNARHSVAQRLCRLLLMMEDRVGGPRLPLTQEDLALMLGVRRAGISTVVGELEASGIVTQGRGYIDIQNRPALGKSACGCYGLMHDNQEHLEEVAGHLVHAVDASIL